MATVPLIETRSRLFASSVQTSEDLQRLGPEWKELFRRIACDNVFLSFEWMSEWWKHLGKEGKLFVIAVRDEAGRLVGLAPLYISSQAGPLRIRRVGFLGDRWVGSCYPDLLIDPTHSSAALDCLAAFVREQQEEWDYFELLGRHGDSITMTDFRRRLEGRGVNASVTHAFSSLYVRLPKTPELYFASHGKRMRRNLNYYSRALKKEGKVDFVTLQHAADLETGFDELLRLHAARFVARGRESAFVNRRVAEFHRAVLRVLARANWVRIYLLKLDGRAIAALYGFSAGAKMFFYQSGIDPTYSRFSVGVLLFSAAIEDAIRSNHTEVDFLSGEQTYKFHWATDSRETDTMRLIKESRKGHIIQATNAITASLRKWKRLLVVGGSAVVREVSASAGNNESVS